MQNEQREKKDFWYFHPQGVPGSHKSTEEKTLDSRLHGNDGK